MINNIRNNSLIRAIKLVTKYQSIEFIVVNIFELTTTLLVANATVEINKTLTSCLFGLIIMVSSAAYKQYNKQHDRNDKSTKLPCVFLFFAFSCVVW